MGDHLISEDCLENQQSPERESAYAIQYKDPESLPHVIASGSGRLAGAILQLAREHGIPVQENQELAGILQEIPRQGTLPPESLGLIAEVIAFLYHCNEQWASEHTFMAELLPKTGHR